jgi:hypothetical protein
MPAGRGRSPVYAARMFGTGFKVRNQATIAFRSSGRSPWAIAERRGTAVADNAVAVLRPHAARRPESDRCLVADLEARAEHD